MASQLSQRGWAASLTVGNMPRTDIVAQQMASDHQLIAVQSKAANRGGSFQVGIHGELPSRVGANEWYVFIEFDSPEVRPVFYVVPRNVVAAFVWIGHRAWLGGTGRGSRKRNDNPMRNLSASELEPYREAWDSLLSPADDAPYVMPRVVVGLPCRWRVRPTGRPPGRPPETSQRTVDAVPNHQTTEPPSSGRASKSLFRDVSSLKPPAPPAPAAAARAGRESARA